MKLSHILEGVTVSKLFQTMYGQMVVTQDVEVNHVQYDSRKIETNDCFVAIKGSASDGHQFIQSAIGNGAKVVVLENDALLPDPLCMHTGVMKVVVPDSRKALAIIAANMFYHPADAMTVIGVTGTNGKTTTSSILKYVLEAAGNKTGLIGTIEYKIGETVIPATHTTPESLELQMLFSQMLKEGCSAVSMEVSSHALDQSRVFGIGFKVAVFTNLTQDHLDYHGTMERYFDAKKILFDSLAADSTAVINVDDSWGERLCSDAKLNIVSYGITSKATVQATDVRLSLDGTVLTLNDEGQTRELRTHLVGRFNAYNVLAAYAAGKAVGIAPEIILQGIAAVPNIRGRFERIVSSKGWTAIIDFAHTPDALEKCLKTIDDVLPSKKRGRIITVFGAGGDRDRAKRPLMGRVVGEWSDIAVVTSDNPRTEDPEKIVDEVLSGIQGKAEVRREPDRRAAIAWALQQAVPGDVVLIAGKGHEEYQIIGTQKRHFSDREQVELFV